MKTLLTLLFCAFTAQAATVRLIWDRNPEPDVVSYWVHVGSSSRNYTQRVHAGNDIEASVSGLNLGQTYYFSVTAVNSSGLESDYSNEVVYTVPSRPSAPTNPRVQFESAAIDWRGVTNRTGTMVQPVLIVPGEAGLSVKATVATPAGSTTRTVTIGQSGVAEFAGRSTSRPFTATGDISLVSIDPDITETKRFE